MSNGLRSARRALNGGSSAYAAKSRKEQQRTQKLGGMIGAAPVEGMNAAVSAMRSGRKAMSRFVKSLRMRLGHKAVKGEQ